jgi:acetyltransferase-like isoleucine patch superfamily enzyme
MTSLERFIHFLSRARVRIYTAVLSGCLGHMGKGSVILPPCRFMNLHRMRIDDEVLVERGCWLLAMEGDGSVIEPRIHLKSGVSVGMGSSISAAKSVVLEEYVLLARNVYISDNSHRFDDIETPISRQGLRPALPVVVGRHTWIGQNACILPGVHIGQHCVIGANAVVNKNVPAYSVVVGVPARIIKRYCPEEGTWKSV